jgi:hypothetical protein
VTARREFLSPPSVASTHNGTQTVSVTISGDTENPGQTSAMARIRRDDLRVAIGAALVQTRVFAAVVDDGTADYRLDVGAYWCQIAGFSAVTMVLGGPWKLTRVRDGTVVVDEFVRGEGRKTGADAFSGRTRLLLAVEAAARDFIAHGIGRLGEVVR